MTIAPRTRRVIRPNVHPLVQPIPRPMGDPRGNKLCLALDGSGWASVAHDPAHNLGVGDSMLEAWVKLNEYPSGGAIYDIVRKRQDANDQWRMMIDHNGYPENWVESNNSTKVATSNVLFPLDSWHHILWLRDVDSPTGLKIYTDGAEQTYSTQEDASGLSSLDNTGSFRIGHLTRGQIALVKQWYLGYGGLPTASGTTPADYALWRWKYPYAPLDQFASGAWEGYSDADKTELWDTNASVFTSGTYNWIVFGSNTLANVGNTLEITYFDDGKMAHVLLRDSADLNADLVEQEYYELQLDAKYTGGSAGVKIRLRAAGVSYDSTPLTTNIVTYRLVFLAGNLTENTLRFAGGGANNVVTVDNLSVMRVGVVGDWPLDGPDGSGNYPDRTSNNLDLTPGGSGNRFVNSDVIFYT